MDARNGKGHRAYRRAQAALKRRAKAQNVPCSVCGEAIDYDGDPQGRRSFTADHPVALKNGGSLVGQELVVMCRSCNARKGDHGETEIWAAT